MAYTYLPAGLSQCNVPFTSNRIRLLLFNRGVECEYEARIKNHLLMNKCFVKEPLLDIQLSGEKGSPKVTLEECSGHTPGHMILRLSDPTNIAYFIGDAVNFDLQINCPKCSSMFDWNPEEAARNRSTLHKRALSYNAYIMTALLQGQGYGKPVQDPSSAGKMAIQLFD